MLGLQPDDIGLLVSASDPRLSPDGSRVAFSVQRVDRERNRYQTRVRVASADGATPAVALSPDDVSADLARWSPDGTQIVYAARSVADDDAVIVAREQGSHKIGADKSAAASNQNRFHRVIFMAIASNFI